MNKWMNEYWMNDYIYIDQLIDWIIKFIKYNRYIWLISYQMNLASKQPLLKLPMLNTLIQYVYNAYSRCVC